MAKLDSLIIDLQVNTAELKKGLEEANDKLSKFGKKMDDLAGVITFEKIGGMAKDAAKALASFVLSGSEAVDKLGKMAVASGMSAEEFSRLNFAAAMTGVSTDDFNKAVLNLGKNIVAASASQKEQVALFDVLGVKATEASGKLRSSGAVMNDLAKVFNGLKDGAAKTQLAIDVFGKGGEKVLGMFENGAEGLAAFGVEADKFGITVSSSAAKSTAEFNDALTKLELIAQGVGGQVASQLAPAFSNLLTQLTQTKGGTDSLNAAATTLATTLKVLVSAGVVVGAVFEIVGKEIARTFSILVNIVKGNGEAIVDDAKGYFTDIVDASRTAGERLEAIWSESPASEAMKKEGEDAKKSADEMAASIERKKKALAEYEGAYKELTKVATDYENKVAAFGKGALALLEERLNSGDLSEKLKKIGDQAVAMKDRILQAAEALQQLELGKINVDIEFQRERGKNATAVQVSDMRRDYSIRADGRTAGDVARLDTAGYKNFEDALKKYQDALNKYTSLMGDVEIAKAQSDVESAQKFQLAADAAGRAVDDASKAIQGFGTIAEEARENIRAAMQVISGAIAAAGGQLLGKMKDLGDVIQAGIQGFQSGGWIGAIVGVVIELFSKFERFGEIVEYGVNQIEMVIDQIRPALEVFTDAFLNFMQMSQVITKIIFQFLGPIIRVFGRILDFIVSVLTPILSLVSTLLESMEPLTEGLFSLIDAFSPLPYIVKFVATVFNFVSLGVLGVMLGIYTAWGWVLGVVRDVMKFFLLDTKEIEATMATHADKTREISDRMGRIWNDITNPYANTDSLETPEVIDTSPTEIDLGGLGDSARGAANKLNEFSQSLTNVPQGFKYQLRAFEASASSSDGTGLLDGLAGRGDNITIEGSIFTEEEIFAFFERIRRRKAFQNSGSTANLR